MLKSEVFVAGLILKDVRPTSLLQAFGMPATDSIAGPQLFSYLDIWLLGYLPVWAEHGQVGYP